MAPKRFSSDPNDHALFRFDYGLAVGRPARACFVSTNGREFDKTGGKGSLFTGQRSVSLDAPAPTSQAVGSYMPPFVAKEEAEPEAMEAVPDSGNETQS